MKVRNWPLFNINIISTDKFPVMLLPFFIPLLNPAWVVTSLLPYMVHIPTVLHSLTLRILTIPDKYQELGTK
jgi:hypothetical protein